MRKRVEMMKDRYLIKAKTYRGDWVRGLLASSNSKWYIGNRAGRPLAFEIQPDTICQYTGLKDKNGNLIWENDIVFVTDDDGCSGQIDTGVGEIDFLDGLWYISGNVQNALYDIDKCFQLEVIGNIFDNKELLESEV